MEINFIGGAYLGRSSNINAQVCQNLYPILDQQGGKVMTLMNTPGLELFCTPGLAAEVRGFTVMGDYIYSTIGNKVYQTDIAGFSTLMTGVLLTPTGHVWMSNNGTQIMIVDGTYMYVLSGTTVTQVTAFGGTKASALITSDGINVADGDTVTLGAKTYTFKTALTPAEGEVLIGSNAANSLYTLWVAVNHAGVPGVDYSCAAAHPTVEAIWHSSTQNYFESRTVGGASNSYVSTEVSTHLSFGSATFLGGVDASIDPLIIPSSLTYQDGYFIVSKAGSGRFYISESYDGTSWDALDYATAEGNPDNLVCLISANRELWLLGSESYEVWYNSGAAAFPFERIGNTFNRIGCVASGSVAEHQGVICWLDNFRFIRASQGYVAAKISTPQIDYQISQYLVVSNAIAYMYSQEGHTFYVLTFPSENKTWVYDFTTQLWHTRASGVNDFRHLPNCYAFLSGMHIIGDPSNGNLYKYNLSKYTDNGETIRRVRTGQAINNDRKNIFHHSLELEFESGVGAEPSESNLLIQPSNIDTDLVQANPATNYGASDHITIYADPVPEAIRTILRFDFSSIPDDVEIISANLGLYYYSSGATVPVGRTYWANELFKLVDSVEVPPDWVETEATWNEYLTGSAWITLGGDFLSALRASCIVPVAFGWMNWNVLNLVKHFQSDHGKIANFLIKDGTETTAIGVGCLFHSSEYATDTSLCPKLEITYLDNTGVDPQAMLEWSDDGGHTWSNEHWISIGKIGEYKKRAVWRRLGRSRDRVYRVTISDPVKTVIIGAHLEATPGIV